jgi:hypothetical protein
MTNSSFKNDFRHEEQENKVRQIEDKIKRKNDKAAIFKKLQDQLNEFKGEMFTTQESQDPKLAPFKKDSKKYMDKLLDLMNIIN